MRTLLIAALLIALAPTVLASQPGHPLDCADWTILSPGVTCRIAIPWPCGYTDSSGNPWPQCYEIPAKSTFDTEGALFWFEVVPTVYQTYQFYRVNLHRWTEQADEVVAYIDDRQPDPRGMTQPDYLRINGLRFDATNGRLHIPAAQIHHTLPNWSSHMGYALYYFEGFARTADLVMSYETSANRFSFRTPAVPEGLRGVDRFDTYTGEVNRPLDLTHARPLQCGYPSSPPQVGDYEQITATVPTPVPGKANYVLTTVTYQGQTRAGRQAIDGHLHGRDASQLPACVIDNRASAAKAR